jgi:hypothetical protein
MDFKKATDELFSSVTADDLATALDVSVQAIRQARAEETSSAFRAPPQGWERAVLKLAVARGTRYARLADAVGAGAKSRNGVTAKQHRIAPKGAK